MPIGQTIVLVGLMGAGKSRVGLELAKLMGLSFVDADREIEKSAGMTVQEIFERYGEKEFRAGEKKVMLRLLTGEVKVLASGGGAFMQPEIRAEIKEKAISVWLKADLETLVARTSRTTHRPLLAGADRAEKLSDLMDARYPVYAQADITVPSDGSSPAEMAQRIREALLRHADQQGVHA